jgi:alpha-maltose-1-phosphate synthase
MPRKLKIAVATAGRFHVLNLARELNALAYDVKFYSYVPSERARMFGLPDECHVSLLPFLAPVLLWARIASWVAPKLRERVLYTMLNRAVMMRLFPCDVFICMSGMYLEAALEARRRYGARIWLERGSRHILSQDEILSVIPGAERPTTLTVDRELAGYALADKIVIPSKHVDDSFRIDACAHRKLFRNPYGVDLKMFPQRLARLPNNPFTLLFVGRWSLQKGCDVLVAAVKRTPGVRLLHVGGMGDLAFPAGDVKFSHVNSVQEQDLKKFYAVADAVVLASRQEGLSLVIAQALASGVSVICSDRTGGADLAHTPALAERITVIPHDNIEALSDALARHRDRACKWSMLDESDRATLSWAAYAKRYSDELRRSIG